jgi:hypothetical protein
MRTRADVHRRGGTGVLLDRPRAEATGSRPPQTSWRFKATCSGGWGSSVLEAGCTNC